MKRLKTTSVLVMFLLSSLVLLVPAPALAETGPMDIGPMGTSRVVLFEQFTAGGCGFCPPVSQGLQLMESNYGRDEVVILSYHGTMGGDPLAVSYTPTRMNSYGFSGYPSVAVDGVLHKVGGGGTGQQQFGLLEDLYDQRKAVASELTITIEGELNPLTEMGDILVNVTAVDAPSEDNLVLHTVVFENQVDYNAPNGENVHDFVVRQMLNGSAGKSISLVKGQTLVNSFEFPFPTNQDPDEIGVIAFVQTTDRTQDGTRYDMPVLQAAYKKVVPVPNVPPVLSFGHIDTSNGNSEDDDVTFKVKYTDIDDLKDVGPSEAKVYFKSATSGVIEHAMNPVTSTDLWKEGRWLAWTTKLDPGTYTYRFTAKDAEDDALGDIGWNATEVVIKPRNNAPDVMDPGFVPFNGDTSTLFRFDIMYRDADNEQPVSAQVFINGVGYTMTTTSTGPWNDWQVFYYETTLPVGENHKFYYLFSDGIDEVRHPEATDSPNWLAGPEVVAPNNEPSLTTALFSPSEGTRLDEFTFTIIYTDGENERPTLSYIYIDGTPYIMDGDGDNYKMGVTFRYRTTLGLGTHQVYYAFSDGKHEARHPASGVLEGPEVTNLAPLAVIASPASGVRYTPDDYVPLSATGSEDPEEDELTYTWVSDRDGQISTMPLADKRLSQGEHNITLTVTDEHGAEATSSISLTVKPYLAEPFFVDYLRTPNSPIEKDIVRYTVYLNNRGEKSAQSLTVSFLVDNTYVDSTTVNVPIDTQVEVRFAWPSEAGEHTILFEIPGDDLTFTEYVNINKKPAADPIIVNTGDDKGRYKPGEEVYFKAIATDGDGDHLTYLWDFGDMVTSTEENPSHIYEKAGTYPVTLTITDDRGGVTVETFNVEVVRPASSDGGGLSMGIIAAIVVVVLVVIVAIAFIMMRGRGGGPEETGTATEEPKPDVPDYLMPDPKPSTPDEPEYPDYSNGIPEEQSSEDKSEDGYLGY
jgi:hypothetical protein